MEQEISDHLFSIVFQHSDFNFDDIQYIDELIRAISSQFYKLKVI